MPKWLKNLKFVLLWMMCLNLTAMVIPAPGHKAIPRDWSAQSPELPKSAETMFPLKDRSDVPLPSHILALMVEFDDVHFKTQPQYPDFLPHDSVFFERWMLHLHDFFFDASHGEYDMSYVVHPQTLRLPKSMAHYGGDTTERTDKNLGDILPDLMPLCSDIDFSIYDGLIIFHAGQGQETDIHGESKDSIWSTFLSRRYLQNYFDPENDDYPGFTTPDGTILTNVVIVPEDQYHDYFPAEGEEDAELHLFSIFGVLAHQYGHILGLPTLFDNVSSNGISQGIGNWGLMGTGVWNASGYVPAQLSAWSRYYLGWEEAITVYHDSVDLPLDHFLNHAQDATRLYKVPISEREYFLIENRQQNPDGSLDPYTNLPSYSFKLLPEDQDYYDDFPLMPFFNFMKNRYSGCEWDFFLPGFGNSPLTDGSGILIWHIDENVIAENFRPNFDINRINGDANHKGVDLEEADGVQDLDTGAYSEYKHGGPYDSYRAGNNDYFGHEYHQGLLWLPTAESYYGGIPLEIYDISESANQMTFSVRFAWKMQMDYEGESKYPAAAVDFLQDGSECIFYPMESGLIALFKDDTLMHGYPLQLPEITHLYTWDGETFYIPTQMGHVARLARKDKVYTYYTNIPYHRFLSHPVDMDDKLALLMENTLIEKSLLYFYDKAEKRLIETDFLWEDKMASNMSWDEEKLHLLSLPKDAEYYRLLSLDLEYQTYHGFDTTVPADSTVVGIFTAKLGYSDALIVQCLSSIYVYDMSEYSLNLRDGFPFIFDGKASAPLSLQDIDGNGMLDILFATSNRVYAIDHYANLITPKNLDVGLADDGISAGAIALDLDGDGSFKLCAAMNMNRLFAWEKNYRLKNGYPVSFAERGRHLPFIAHGADGEPYLWVSADNGSLFRNHIPNYVARRADDGWQAEYGDLRRRASRMSVDLSNQYQSAKVFVKDELYFFPNPLKSFYNQEIKLSIMPTKDVKVSLKIFDISGKLVFQSSGLAREYLRNQDLFHIPVDKLSPGIYIAIIKGGGESHKLRFGIEK